jgi:hypothetical protein
MPGISLLQHLHKQAQSAWNGISTEQLLEELRQVQQFVLLYPPQGEKGPNRITTVLSNRPPPSASSGQNLGLGSTAYYPTWAIPSVARKRLTAQIRLTSFGQKTRSCLVPSRLWVAAEMSVYNPAVVVTGRYSLGRIALNQR